MNKKEYKFSPFFEMVDTIIQKPDWFGIQKVQDIYFFISGYKSCIMGSKIIDPDYERFNKFDDYVHQVYNDKTTNNWAGLITFHSMNDQNSIEEFSKLFIQFRNQGKK